MTDPLTPARLAEIRGRLEAATPGPWDVWAFDLETYHVDGPGGCFVAESHCGHTAALIAHAPADLAALLEDHARQAAEIARLRKQVEAHKKNERARWGNAREVLGLDARGGEGS